jgi:large subunit ribosomal protein L17
MMRNMVTSLFEHEQIRTTDAKAKELRKVAERMIGLAKEGSLHSRRQALSYIRSKKAVHKLFEELGPRYAARSGGYLHINKLGPRIGDGAPVSIVTLVTDEVKKPRRRRRRRKPAAKTAPAPQAEQQAAEEAQADEPVKAAEEAPVEEPKAEGTPAEEAAAEAEEAPAEAKAEAAPEEAPKEEAPAEEAPAEDEKKEEKPE